MAKAAKSLGRLELLQWINDFCETDYAKVEACSDGIAFCQILDAVHPQCGIPLQKLCYTAKNKDDCARNLQLFATYAKKMKVPFSINVPELANGRFQHTIECVQLLYDYQTKVAPKVAGVYNGFERRMEAYRKQNGFGPE